MVYGVGEHEDAERIGRAGEIAGVRVIRRRVRFFFAKGAAGARGAPAEGVH